MLDTAEKGSIREKGELNLADQIQERAHLGAASASIGVLAKNTAANLVQPGTAWLIVLVLPPLLIRTMDRPTYATWMLLLQIGTYVLVLNDSIRLCARHFVGRARGLDDRAYLTRILSSGTLVLAAAGLIAALLSLLFYAEFPHLFRSIPAALIPQATVALLVLCWTAAGGLPFSILSGAFEGYQKSVIPAVLSGVFRIVGAIGIAWAAYHRQGLVAMALWFGASNLLLRVSFVPAWKKWGTGRLLRLSSVAFSAMREFLKFWGLLLASQLSGVLITGMDLPIVTAFDFRNAAYYAIASTLASMIMTPYTAMIAAVQPVASSMSARGTPERLGDAVVKLTRWSGAILVLMALPLLSGMSIFLRIWVGSNYAVHTLPIGMVLVTSVIVREHLRPYTVTVLCAGRQARTLVAFFVESIVNVIFSLLLVHRIGAIGVAFGTLIGAFAGVGMHFLVSMRLTSDVVHIDRGRLVWEGMMRPLVCGAVGYLLIMEIETQVSSPAYRFIVIALVTAAVAVVLFRWNFKSHEREEISRLVLRRFRAPAPGVESIQG
jgi:O-antigen/teichoic acid export membrane protein